MVAKTFEEAIPADTTFTVVNSKGAFMSGPYTLFEYAFKESVGDILGRMRDADHEACDAAFADQLVRAMADHLSPNQISLVVKGFGEELIKWSKDVGSEEAMRLSFDTFEDLLDKSTKR